MQDRLTAQGSPAVTNDDLLAQGRPGDLPGEARYMALAVLVGTMAGLIGSLFHLLVNQLIVWPQLLERVASGWPLAGMAALVTMACTVLALFMVRRFAPEAGGSGVQEIEGALAGLRPVRWRRVLPDDRGGRMDERLRQFLHELELCAGRLQQMVGGVRAPIRRPARRITIRRKRHVSISNQGPLSL